MGGRNTTGYSLDVGLGLRVNPELHPSPWVVKWLGALLSGKWPANSQGDR